MASGSRVLPEIDKACDLSGFERGTGPDLVAADAPGQSLRAFVQRTGSNLLASGTQDHDRAAIITGIGVGDEGEVLAVGREAKIVDEPLTEEHLADRVLELTHKVRGREAHDSEGRAIRGEVGGLDVFDLGLGSTGSCGARQITGRK